MNIKATLTLVGGLMLSGCQSTSTPEWALNPTVDTNMSLYAVGHGGTLKNAKRSAMSQMNEKLWTQVESSGYVRQVVRDVNGDENYRTQSDTVVDVKTAPLVLSGVSYNRSEQRDGIYYVEAVISRENIIHQLKQELTTIDENAKTELINFKHSDPLIWWLNNRDIDSDKQNLLTRKAMLLAASNSSENNIPSDNVIELERQVNKIKNSLLFSVNAEKSDAWMRNFIENHLSEKNIATVNSSSSRNAFSHQIVLTTHWRQSKIGEAYISTVIAKLALKNKNGKTVASSEVIATGNSITNFTRAKESASRHFSAQISDQGLWHFLGVI
ncbi:LPP20 family lipoprotein [Photobacterium makurazakiensis]|uniref:hypothetical protein n=1 Tax=Photobacterium makurazakiensis TaxID=2910234 RepID=UPI003D09F174